MKQVHIGHLIRAELRREGRTNLWLASRIGVTERTLQRIFNKPSIDTQQLLLICKFLQVDLFRHYSQALSGMTNVVR
ncbi:MAG: helix-turn-helix transcriptional regulator [Bacteroidales bacterium]|nr:helix-turn-helix transcriptional regulator [Bacteroidales bacterium]